MTVPLSTDRTDQLESALGPDLRFTLRELLELHGIPPDMRDAWWRIPSFRVFVTAGVCRRARVLRVSKGWSKERSLAEACAELGAEFETVRSRLKRAFDSAYLV